jgi:hypothetical protein
MRFAQALDNAVKSTGYFKPYIIIAVNGQFIQSRYVLIIANAGLVRVHVGAVYFKALQGRLWYARAGFDISQSQPTVFT